MSVIQNQQTGLAYIAKINGTEITEHNRKVSTTITQSGTDVELGRGIIRRYIRKNKKSFNFSFSYLPNTSDKTVDGRAGRDFLNTLSLTKGTVNLSIKMSPTEDYETYVCYVDSYSEILIRREIGEACSYYDVEISLGEQ
jgi:hypothetical protein